MVHLVLQKQTSIITNRLSDPVEEVTVEVDYASYVAAGEGNRKIIYDYDYEVNKNEAKRQINLVQPVFVSTILDEARQTFR